MPSRERATCGGCGLVCTGIEVLVGDGVELHGTCGLGDAWFAERLAPPPPLARVDGREAPLDEALDEAVAILRAARAPLVCGLTQATIEAQREAVAIAAAIGATIDSGASPLAFQELGASTATIGEIPRARLVVVWRADPKTTHPLLELPRPLVAVGEGPTATSAEADELVTVPAEGAVEALWTLRALVRGVPTPAGPDLEPLAERLRGSPHTVLLHDVRDHLEAFALHALVRDVAPLSHLVTLRLRRDFNAAGAEDVVTWRTGYPGAVSLAAGSPRAADHLGGDVVLAVGAAVPNATISVGPRPGETARVAIATAAAGVHRAGTTHRLDGVPVPLYAPVRSDRPGDDEVLRAIAGRLAP